MPPYTRDWGSATGAETLLAAACRHLVKLEDVSRRASGDVLVFRMRDQGVAKHAGIVVALSAHQRSATASLLERGGLIERDGARLVHAQEGLGVVEIELGHWWLVRHRSSHRSFSAASVSPRSASR
jgi:hypothetical protein